MSESYENRREEESNTNYPFAVAVRFRNSGKPYSFGSYDSKIKKGDWVVVETAQGIEMGQVEADALSVEKYGLHMPSKPIIRTASKRDRDDYAENLVAEEEAFAICSEEIKSLGLDMHLLSSQYTLDKSKILFVYLSDQRVDFRELLKKLGARLRCRIELRQIGERDKAKMVGGIGMCGMECCCRRFKNHFDVISINMAKNQLLALNIDKLSGMCGKLMCCLKYEDQDYKEMTQGLPKMGSQVEYEGNIYRITGMNVMSSEAKLENRETAMFITLDELREKAIPRKGVVQPRSENAGKKPVHKQVIHSGAPHVSMEVKIEHHEETTIVERRNNHRAEYKENRAQGKTETRSFGSKNKNKGAASTSPKRHSNTRQREEKHPDTKNITVRTFGKKKAEDKQS